MSFWDNIQEIDSPESVTTTEVQKILDEALRQGLVIPLGTATHMRIYELTRHSENTKIPYGDPPNVHNWDPNQVVQDLKDGTIPKNKFVGLVAHLAQHYVKALSRRWSTMKLEWLNQTWNEQYACT
eukprot:TRINITY_DN67997_c9_g2_i3.p1 TRINITY_DN67997_c9_g2~~TRINITY_DN67997_c9_g2_i3.p1  ORF type:complete len:126 (+),score=2.07 TRINITY_DN67997_c9_g2_i3:47-424(+)